MKALQIQYDKDKDDISTMENQEEENWAEVCERFDNDVHRICNVEGHPPFTALFACYDEDNKPSYYLVKENHRLDKLRHKVFFDKLGRNT